MNASPLREPWPDRHLWQIRPIRDLLIVVAILLVLWGAYLVNHILAPVLVGLVLAYLLTPLIDLAQRRGGVPRAWMLTFLLLLLPLTAAGLGVWLVPPLVSQTSDLLSKAPEHARSLMGYLDERFGIGQDGLEGLVDNLSNQKLFSGTSWAFGVLGNVIGAATYSIMMIILVPIYFFVFTLHFHEMQEWFKRFIPQSRRARTIEILGKMDTAVGAFFRGRLIVAAVMAVLFAVGWCPLITDVPYWLVLALLTGLLSLIPYAAGIGWLLALLLKAVETAGTSSPGAWDWAVALGGPTLVYALVQAFEGWLLTPWFQGKSLGMGAATVLIVVLIGGAAGGLVGLIVAIPLAACTKILLEDVILPWLSEWASTH